MISKGQAWQSLTARCALSGRELFERLRESIQLGAQQKWLPQNLAHKWQMHYNNEGVERRPKDFTSYHAFGMMLLFQGNYTQAMPNLKKAVRYCPKVRCSATTRLELLMASFMFGTL